MQASSKVYFAYLINYSASFISNMRHQMQAIVKWSIFVISSIKIVLIRSGVEWISLTPLIVESMHG